MDETISINGELYSKVKPKPKFPIVFDIGCSETAEIDEDGHMTIYRNRYDTDNNKYMYKMTHIQYDRYIEAIKKAKEIRGKCQ